MPDGIRCPNASCTHVFSRAELLRHDELLCPGCGRRLLARVRSAPAGVPLAPAAPPATIPPQVPLATATAGAGPLTFGETAVIAPTARIKQAQRRRGRWVAVVGLIGLAATALAGVGAAVHWLPADLQEIDGPRPVGVAQDFPEYNCRFIVPPRPWLAEATAAHGLRAVFVLHRPDPDTWLALLARQYHGPMPKPEVLQAEVVRRLQGYFSDHVEVEPVADAPLAGKQAQRLIFRGQRDEAVLSGECRYFAHQGIAYWFLAWAPAAIIEDVAEEFDSLRRRLSLLDPDRPGNPEAIVQTFRGQRTPGTVETVDEAWKEWQPPTDHHPDADLVLYVPGQPGREPITASAWLLVPKDLPADKTAAVQALRDRVGEHLHKASGLPAAVVTLKPGETTTMVGNAQGILLRLNVRLGETRERFVLLAVVPRPSGTLAWQCECAWRLRDEWEPRFLELLAGWRLPAP